MMLPLLMFLFAAVLIALLFVWRFRPQTAAENRSGEVERLTTRLRETEAHLTQARADLVTASLKLQTDEAAARHFENVSQKVLKTVLGEVRRESQTDLEKHAACVAQTMEPLHDKLRGYDEAVQAMRRENSETTGGLRQQMETMQKAEANLHEQARALTCALQSSPKVKGMYGEMMLRRVVEFAGMQKRCAYEEQLVQKFATDDGVLDKRKIPDMEIYLPGEQKVIVDAKAVMGAYLEAQQESDPARQMELMHKHCENVRARVVDLSSKTYWAGDKTGGTVEAVVLFLPAESLYAAAVQHDPDLSEFALSRDIVLCGPNALLVLLKVAHQVWGRAAIAEEAEDIALLGNEMYQATCGFITNFAYLGDSLRKTGDAYNKCVGILDNRLLSTGRELKQKAAIRTERHPLGSAPALRGNVQYLRSGEARQTLLHEHHALYSTGNTAEDAVSDAKIG